MRKLFTILLIALLTLVVVACGANKPAGDDGASNNAIDNKEELSITSALELLTTVWDSYSDDERFPAAGGDMSEENMAMDAPGKFGVEDAEALDVTLGFPVAAADRIDDAASLMHMLNANTFTCGVFHAKDTGDVAELSAAIKENIMQRQWLCGFPDKLMIVQAGDYIISFFGANETVDTFKTKLDAAYPFAETICDEPIV